MQLFKHMKCLDIKQITDQEMDVSLQNTFESETVHSFLELAVKPCSLSTGCATTEDVRAFFRANPVSMLWHDQDLNDFQRVSENSFNTRLNQPEPLSYYKNSIRKHISVDETK